MFYSEKMYLRVKPTATKWLLSSLQDHLLENFYHFTTEGGITQILYILIHIIHDRCSYSTKNSIVFSKDASIETCQDHVKSDSQNNFRVDFLSLFLPSPLGVFPQNKPHHWMYPMESLHPLVRAGHVFLPNKLGAANLNEKKNPQMQ